MPFSVSESMAAFIAAEKFSGESLSESEIQMAMELAQQRHNGTRNNGEYTQARATTVSTVHSDW